MKNLQRTPNDLSFQLNLNLDWLFMRSVKQWLNRLGIAQKIGLGYAVSLSFAIAGMITGSVVGNSYQRQARKLIDDVLEENILIENLQTSLVNAQTHQRGLVVFISQPEDFWKEYSRFKQNIIHARESWSKLKTSYINAEVEETSEELEAFDKLIEKYEGQIDIYFQETEKIVQQITASSLQPAELEKSQKLLLDFYRRPISTKLDTFAKSIDEIHEVVIEEKLEAVANLKAIEDRWNQIMAVSIILSILTSTLLAIKISKAISLPLRSVTNVAQQVTQESNFDLQVTIKSQDELGVLASSFNYLIQSVKNLLLEQQEVNQQLKIYSTNLEQKVLERTHDLSVQNQQLEEILRELRHTQSQLIQTEKMSSLGQMVAGIAHEINNPVSFIHGNLFHAQNYTNDLLRILELYKQHYPNPSEEIKNEIKAVELDFLVEDLTKIIESMIFGTERITKIILGLRTFARLDEADFKSADIHDGIDSTLMILEHRLKANRQHSQIRVIKEYEKLPCFYACHGQLNQVFMNLIANAIDALEDSVISYNIAEPMIRIRTKLIDNKCILISIEDNGCGMTEETRAKLFDPFFTTKPVGKGTGLGLSISYQIVVEKHKGSLEVNSTLGEGTEFLITIPLTEKIANSIF